MGRWNSKNKGAEAGMCIPCLWNKDLDLSKAEGLSWARNLPS